jgi:copper chaperone
MTETTFYSRNFDAKLTALGVAGIQTPYRAPKANAIAERLVWSRHSRRRVSTCSGGFLTCVKAQKRPPGCNESASYPQRFQEVVTMRTAKFQTEPFTCPSCIKKIEGVVRKRDGVDKAEVMFNSSKVKVSFDENVTSVEEIAQSITDLGYPVLSSKVG